jgi:small-conductance mechanosensitive channel
VGVAYGSDVRLVERLLLEAANGHEDISANPKPFVRFNDFGNSSLDFQLYFWTANGFYVENLKSELRFAIDDLFRKNDINIPFPQTDVHFKNPIIVRNDPS